MQRYEEKGRANITLSHFLLVVDYQIFKVIEGSIINKKREAITYLSYATCKKYLHVQRLVSIHTPTNGVTGLIRYYFLLLLM